jgi:hypothetical protein
LASQKEEGVQNAIELSRMKQKLATLGAEYEHVSKSYGQAKDDCCITYKKLLAARKEIPKQDLKHQTKYATQLPPLPLERRESTSIAFPSKRHP